MYYEYVYGHLAKVVLDTDRPLSVPIIHGTVTPWWVHGILHTRTV